jgi:DNA-binding CsgD family transcriptional regulator/preprotein translocase subunit SecG
MNEISVSIHQSRLSSSDCSFDLQLIRHNDLFSLNKYLRTQNSSEQFFNKSFSLLSMQFEMENKNNEINHLKISNDSLRRYILFIAFFFILLLIVLFYITLNGLKKSNKLENEIQKITNDLSQKNKEIINYALNSVQIKRFVKSIKDELNDFGKKIPSNDLLSLERIITKLSYYDDNEDEWERLKTHFDLIHSGFFSKLKSEYPLLTQTELEHCSFIKLQLPTKEIARMLNIDPKSVQASRYRIKKKMDLPLESDLRDVIEKF